MWYNYHQDQHQHYSPYSIQIPFQWRILGHGLNMRPNSNNLTSLSRHCSPHPIASFCSYSGISSATPSVWTFVVQSSIPGNKIRQFDGIHTLDKFYTHTQITKMYHMRPQQRSQGSNLWPGPVESCPPWNVFPYGLHLHDNKGIRTQLLYTTIYMRQLRYVLCLLLSKKVGFIITCTNTFSYNDKITIWDGTLYFKIR
jgi:hypothetical protein